MGSRARTVSLRVQTPCPGSQQKRDQGAYGEAKRAGSDPFRNREKERADSENLGAILFEKEAV